MVVGTQTISQEVRDVVKIVDDTSAVAVEVVEELTDEEASERHRLELKVERAFYEAGAALLKLRSRRLYRSTHLTFEEYCRERFGFSRQNVNYLIAASGVVDNLLTTNGCQNSQTNDSQILPTSERQVRPLTTLEPDLQREVWQQAVEEAGGIPSGRIVKSIVERLKEKHHISATESHKVGDAFMLTGLSGTERKYNGCSCVAIAVNAFTVVVDVHDGTLSVKPENLKPIDEPDARRQLPQTLKRLKRLRNVGLLDRGAYYVLEGLGRQTYLTDFEADLLAFMEQRYGIDD